MTNPRFRPRDYCIPSENFGTEESLRWRSSNSESERDQLEVAKLQHNFSRSVRTALIANNLTAEAFSGEKTAAMRLRRLLRGDVILRLEDIVRIRRSLLSPDPAGMDAATTMV